MTERRRARPRAPTAGTLAPLEATAVSLEVARNASEACADLQPKGPPGGAPPEYEAYQRCMTERGVFTMLPVQVEGIDHEAASRACQKLMPQPKLPDEVTKWLSCLAKEGFVIPEDGSDPDLAKGRAALKACKNVEPDFAALEAGPADGSGGPAPTIGPMPIGPTTTSAR